jgi:hypothetical protein
VTLELTATGRRLVRQAAAWREQELARILEQLPPGGRVQVTAALRQLVDAAGEGYGTIPAAWCRCDQIRTAVSCRFHALRDTGQRVSPALSAP